MECIQTISVTSKKITTGAHNNYLPSLTRVGWCGGWGEGGRIAKLQGTGANRLICRLVSSWRLAFWNEKQIPIARMERDFVSACEVQRYVQDHQKNISKASDIGELTDSLSKVAELFLNGSLLPQKVPLAKRASLREEFTSKHYVRFVSSLLRHPVVSCYKKFNQEQKKLFEVFFLQGPEMESLLVLGNALSTSDSEVTNMVVPLLEKFVLDGRFVTLFVNECQSREDRLMMKRQLCSQVITLVVSLPERVANSTRVKTTSVFHHQRFFRTLMLQVVQALEQLHDSLCTSKNCSLKFLSELLGRVCLVGHAEPVFYVLLPAVEKWTQTSPLWSHICRRLITATPNALLEHVVEGILKISTNPNLIVKLLGNSVLTNARLKYLLTSKFLLLKTYTDVGILYNIMGYLSSCRHRHLLCETTRSLFDVWANEGAIKHTSYDQHMYVSCAVVLAVGHMTKEEKEQEKEQLLAKLLAGVQGHLGSPTEKVRRLGMVVAECVSSALVPDQKKLAFEYKRDEETDLLYTLSNGPKLPANQTQERRMPKNKGTEETKDSKLESREGPEVEQESDDDLTPYDLEEDDNVDDCRAPKYLRDCIEGLLESENPSKTEASLRVVKKLTCAEPDELGEICVELVKVLLHLQDQYSIKDFVELRHSAMVAVAVRFPKNIAEYLTEEFYGPNYNLQQRLDMLGVLSDAAQQLSAPKEIAKVNLIPRKFHNLRPKVPMTLESIPEWQVFIQERINRKTKRFSQGPSRPPAKAAANQFASAAGYFFYPLMTKFDVNCNTMDLLGEDSFVLGRLLYTLGSVMFAARSAPSARNMGRTLLNFTWSLKFHSEPLIRQAVMFTQAMVFLSVPSGLLLSDASKELFELHDLLKDVVQNDANAECRKAALQAILLLEDVFKSETGVEHN